MTKHHLIISGTGRAGTTFLVQLFTALGLDTGFTDPASDLNPNCDAGMEWDIRRADAPYIVKSPWLCDHLDEVLAGGRVRVDHALVPVRDLYAAAESRRDVARRTDKTLFDGDVPGGLWHTDEPARQEAVLAEQLYKLIYALTERDIPVTLLHFPRLARDPEYLFGKLEFMLNGISRASFLGTYSRVARPELIHEFGADPANVKLP